MNLQNFWYDLPDKLIANNPPENRDSSRLMLVNRKLGTYEHHTFKDITTLLNANDCLVINDTKVIPARLIGYLETGGKIEILLHRQLTTNRWEILCKPGKKCRVGTAITIGDGDIIAKIDEITEDGLRYATMEYTENWEYLLDKHGDVPLPHYINSTISETEKKERYNTVYAKKDGSVAAPTAGLHFTNEILAELESKGVKIAHITLHVGLGTFRPVKVDNIIQHHMHSEYYQIEEEQAAKINETKKAGGRIIAVGTTSCRTLESCVNEEGQVVHGTGKTSIYIYPGFEFKLIDGLLTNFHLPQSTLIMLVAAFCGLDNIMAAYNAAILEEYRFYSFGDAMLIV
ncbi:MAG: tRNA preQ1(34) S-adenosylmethionine ribosyltransferase-isomerase QueA [Defluviitaleaceae bacterium]|nr:tRNA preQ1(34) S-adenosylmethionine ribosyltransferase-isomerase QueA [Defluviitaleaceae bacterium]